jgi:Family of unknown function (DUF5681)
MNDKPQNGPGRMPPPVEHRFLKGSSGNKRGRPKGSIDLKKLTRKVALKKHRIVVNGRPIRKTLFQLVIETVVRGAASGAPSMVSLHNEIRAKVRPMEEKQPGGLLVVPEGLSSEEFVAKEEARNAEAQDPSTYVNHKSEEFCKAVGRIPTPLGEAILASYRRWNKSSG